MLAEISNRKIVKRCLKPLLVAFYRFLFFNQRDTSATYYKIKRNEKFCHYLIRWFDVNGGIDIHVLL